MKTIAMLLSLSLAVPVFADRAIEAPPAAPGVSMPPLVITAPRPTPQEARRLKRVRAAGGITAVSGAGLLIYGAFFVGAGPIGWAAGLIFCGGVTAYLAHRRLKGHDDFGPTNAAPSSAGTAPSRPSP